jgi:hypothetical protein
MRWALDKTNIYKNRFCLGLLVDRFCKRGEGVVGNPISSLLLCVLAVPLTLLLVNSPTSAVYPSMLHVLPVGLIVMRVSSLPLWLFGSDMFFGLLVNPKFFCEVVALDLPCCLPLLPFFFAYYCWSLTRAPWYTGTIWYQWCEATSVADFCLGPCYLTKFAPLLHGWCYFAMIWYCPGNWSVGCLFVRYYYCMLLVFVWLIAGCDFCLCVYDVVCQLLLCWGILDPINLGISGL